MAERLQGPLRRVNVERDLGRMDFEGELDTALCEDIEDRVEPVGEELKAIVDHLARHRREAVEQVPDRATGKTVDDADTESLGGAGRILQLLGRPLVDRVRLTIAPDMRRQ